MSKLQSVAAIATIIGVIIAAIALIPAFGQWLTPRAPTSDPNAIPTRIQELRVRQAPTSVSHLPTAPSATMKTSSPPESTFARIEVPSSTQDGITWCTNSNGIHEIRYESGAYSPWPSDDGCDPKGCWKGTIFVYRNSNPDSIFAGSSKGEPQNPTLQIGWNDWKKSLEETEIASKGLEAKGIELRKNDCLTFIAIDGRDSYHFPGDNRGKVAVSVKLP